jgi:hypothetical protein
MNRRKRKAGMGLAALSAMLLTLVAPHASMAETSAPTGNPSLRLVSPALDGTNSIDYTFVRTQDAHLGNNYFGAGTKIKFFYVNVNGTVNLTYEARDKDGKVMPNTTVYLIVNKYYSCSEARWTTTRDTIDYLGPRTDAEKQRNLIPRDWCGPGQGVNGGWDTFKGGESSISAVTDANGRATWTLTHDYSYDECTKPSRNVPAVCPEPAPISASTANTYTGSCIADNGCMMSAMTASFVQHPNPIQSLDEERTEDKDLLWVHIVSNAISPEHDVQNVAVSKGSQDLRFRVTNLQGNGQAGVSVTFTLSSGPGDSDISPITGSRNPDGTITATTDADGWASVSAVSDVSATGRQVVTAQITGSSSVTKTAVVWLTAPAVTAASTIAGKAKIGQTLTAKTGTWTNGPSYKYAWFGCKASGKAATAVPAGCTAIKGATKATLKLASAQKNSFVRVRVTGTNAIGAAVSVSAATAKVS